MRNLAIVPARSGSKEVRDKNIRLLGGKPMIAYTIEAAIRSGVFDEVMVSTDSIDYSEISKRFGAAVPFLRGGETASDSASSWDVVAEVLSTYGALGRTFDTFCLLQPTSPLRTENDIQGAYEMFSRRGAKSVVSICEADHSPLVCNTLPPDGSLTGFLKPEGEGRRQDHQVYYRINGAIYICDVASFDAAASIYDHGCFAYIMDRAHSVDIDGTIDFVIAEALLTSGIA